MKNSKQSFPIQKFICVSMNLYKKVWKLGHDNVKKKDKNIIGRFRYVMNRPDLLM